MVLSHEHPADDLVAQLEQLNIASVPDEGNGTAPSDTHWNETTVPTLNPLAAFFATYPGFRYNPSRSATFEYKRLLKSHLGLDPKKFPEDALEAGNVYLAWSRAMNAEFGVKFGVDMHDLGAWQRLCQRIDICPVPEVLEEAREAVFNTHVNLVDLVDRGVVIKHETEQELSRYTKRKKLYFPAEGLENGSILASLLRFIHFPPPEGSRRTSEGILVRGL